MRLYTVQLGGQQKPAMEDSGRLYLLEDLGAACPDMNGLITGMTDSQWDMVRRKAGDRNFLAALPSYPLAEARICAPIPRPLQDVICLGVNYDEHKREVGAQPGGDTVYFSKRVNQASGPLDGIPSYPGYVDSLDYEVELAAVIGRDTRQVSPEEALACVFGYTIINDVSARNLQFRHQQWYLGKSLDGFLPMGPCIVTADELPDVQSLAITCRVNGRLRQSSNTGCMIQPVANAISELSQGMTLKAGTIIATGTPGGVALGRKPPVYLKPGDEVVCEIENIGMLKNTVI